MTVGCSSNLLLQHARCRSVFSRSPVKTNPENLPPPPSVTLKLQTHSSACPPPKRTGPRGLRVVMPGASATDMARSLEAALRFGQPALLQDVGESLDALLGPLLAQVCVLVALGLFISCPEPHTHPSCHTHVHSRACNAHAHAHTPALAHSRMRIRTHCKPSWLFYAGVRAARQQLHGGPGRQGGAGTP